MAQRKCRYLLPIVVVLLLVAAVWWFYGPTVSRQEPEKQIPVTEVPRQPAKVKAQVAVLPGAEEGAAAAEPRIPHSVSDANVGQLAQEQITIVIPAELLKESLQEQDLEIVIRWGDTLWEIAERYTGDPWNYRRIARENGIVNPDLIFPRQKLNIRTEE